MFVYSSKEEIMLWLGSLMLAKVLVSLARDLVCCPLDLNGFKARVGFIPRVTQGISLLWPIGTAFNRIAIQQGAAGL